ncbi:MAG: hypothetical protein M3M99_05840, partial [Actinomycetota bacterium]|nr:hypothetical protein [Actinomycetota bacterium]
GGVSWNDGGAVKFAAGLAVASLGGLELSVREHFAGYRSHTALLAGAVGVATLALMFTLTGLAPAFCGAVGLIAFGLAAWGFASAFRKRSGGALFRFRGG